MSAVDTEENSHGPRSSGSDTVTDEACESQVIGDHQNREGTTSKQTLRVAIPSPSDASRHRSPVTNSTVSSAYSSSNSTLTSGPDERQDSPSKRPGPSSDPSRLVNELVDTFAPDSASAWTTEEDAYLFSPSTEHHIVMEEPRHEEPRSRHMHQAAAHEDPNDRYMPITLSHPAISTHGGHSWHGLVRSPFQPSRAFDGSANLPPETRQYIYPDSASSQFHQPQCMQNNQNNMITTAAAPNAASFPLQFESLQRRLSTSGQTSVCQAPRSQHARRHSASVIQEPPRRRSTRITDRSPHSRPRAPEPEASPRAHEPQQSSGWATLVHNLRALSTPDEFGVASENKPVQTDETWLRSQRAASQSTSPLNVSSSASPHDGEESTALPASPVSPDVEAFKQQAKRYVCSWSSCQKSFSTSGHLSRHNRIHMNVRPYICPYVDCGMAFTRQDNMREHQRTHANKRAVKRNYKTKLSKSSVKTPSPSDE
ncbi:hypothetical protein DFS34DRAFT_692534 [Phlyctochytrium arcticum]|nr:hypothetical protein DFS34DRAFT_692534 [Phlyctochytrium arcticum]